MPVRRILFARSTGYFMALAGVGCLTWSLIAATCHGEPSPTASDQPITGTLEAAGDAKAQTKTELELVGIGAALRSVHGYMEVHEILPGGAADLEGRLKKGDQIVGIGQGPDGEIEDTLDMKLGDAVNLIRGKRDTVVRMEVKPVDNPEQTVVYTITRARIELKNEEARGAVIDEPSDPSKALATPTHHQTAIIKANVENLPATKLKCFALTPEGQVLAGCNGETGEIRVFDNQGNYVETWSTSVQPEAMYVRADGMVFIAGQGQLLKLDSRGNLVKQSPAPHADALTVDNDELRQEVVERAKQTAERMNRQGDMYDRVIEQTEKQIEQLRETAEAAKDDSAEGEAAEKATASKQAAAERRIVALEKRVEQYKQVKARWEETQTDRQPVELTEEQIEQQVQAAIGYKMAASSISATEEEVYVATRAKVGYGFEVWRMNQEFEEGKSIIAGLSGCCGQMDVKVNDQGVFIAENSKHRVCKYDRDGELVTTWGRGDRTSLEGFGSCCNPMNVAFGPEDVVYTAEDNTGRIKRYSPDGKLLGLVGSVDLVPGCKNCSIAVGPGGDQVYMLDITRDHIVRMDRYAPGEAPKPVASTASVPGAPVEVRAAQPPNGGRMMVRGLGTLLRLRTTAKPAEEAEATAAAETEPETNN